MPGSKRMFDALASAQGLIDDNKSIPDGVRVQLSKALKTIYEAIPRDESETNIVDEASSVIRQNSSISLLGNARRLINEHDGVLLVMQRSRSLLARTMMELSSEIVERNIRAAEAATDAVRAAEAAVVVDDAAISNLDNMPGADQNGNDDGTPGPNGANTEEEEESRVATGPAASSSNIP